MIRKRKGLSAGVSPFLPSTGQHYPDKRKPRADWGTFGGNSGDSSSRKAIKLRFFGIFRGFVGLLPQELKLLPEEPNIINNLEPS
jgi:hypothetical protein